MYYTLPGAPLTLSTTPTRFGVKSLLGIRVGSLLLTEKRFDPFRTDRSPPVFRV